jgi:hypothetical protein
MNDKLWSKARPGSVHPWFTKTIAGVEHVFPLDAKTSNAVAPTRGTAIEVPIRDCPLCIAGLCCQVLVGESVCHELDPRFRRVDFRRKVGQ